MNEFKLEGFSKEIFSDRYTFTDTECWEEACGRVAKQAAAAESPDKYERYRKKFEEVLVHNFFVPGGRIWYNSGRPHPQLLNCFVLGHKLDSKEGWGEGAKEVIVTSMSGGGCGMDFSDIRPRGADIAGQRGKAPGPVEYMKLINGTGKPVKAGGHRRVALMFSLALSHPSLMEFLNAKLERGELDLANVSVRSDNTSTFVEAVQNDLEWELSWKGQYKHKVRAREIWDVIVQNAYDSAEPGFLNWELVLAESNIWYIEKLITTNPCGEIAMSSYDACCLGHLVLPRYVKKGELDWDQLAQVVRTGVRFLDNILDVNSFPLPEMKATTQRLRRIGLGTTGLADLMALLGLRYGDKESIQFIDKLFRFISKVAYEASIFLAAEKGSFPDCNPELHVKSGYIKRMPKRIRELIKEHGIRNCAILTQAPTGTVSIISGNCSAGVEPMFAPAYERRFWKGEERKTELVFHPLFKRFMDEGKDVSHFVGAMELSVRDHMEVQKTVQKHIDNAVSKTINMPEDYPIEEMSKLWLEYLPYLKGTTFYRESSRGYVDEDGKVHEPPLKALPLEEAMRRYKEQPDHVEGSEVDCSSGSCDI